jgi:hypothetical protein
MMKVPRLLDERKFRYNSQWSNCHSSVHCSTLARPKRSLRRRSMGAGEMEVGATQSQISMPPGLDDIKTNGSLMTKFASASHDCRPCWKPYAAAFSITN